MDEICFYRALWLYRGISFIFSECIGKMVKKTEKDKIGFKRSKTRETMKFL